MSHDVTEQEQEKSKLENEGQNAPSTPAQEGEAQDSTKQAEPNAEKKAPKKRAKKEAKPGEKVDKKKPAAAHSPVKTKERADKARSKAADITDAVVLMLLAAMTTAEAAFDLTVAAITQALINLDAVRSDLANAIRNARPAFNAVNGVLRATPRGRDFRRECRAQYPWQVAANINARLAGSGLSIPAELLTALNSVCAVGSAAQTAFEEAEKQRKLAVTGFWAAKKELVLAARRVELGVEAIELGMVLAPQPAAPPQAANPPATGTGGGVAVP